MREHVHTKPSTSSRCIGSARHGGPETAYCMSNSVAHARVFASSKSASISYAHTRANSPNSCALGMLLLR